MRAGKAQRLVKALLADEDESVNDLSDRLGLSQYNVSKHLRVLREAGLVDVQIDGRFRLYELRAEPLAEVDRWLEPYRAHWSGRLDALERHLEENP